MKRLLTLLMLALFYYGTVQADNEPANNAPGTTTDVLAMGGSQSGQNSPTDNYDYYQLTSGADGNITVSLTNVANEYVYIYLYNSDGLTQLGSGQGGAQSGIQFTAYGLAAGNYYVLVYSGASQSYTVSASIVSPAQANDVEPNNSPATALACSINTNVTGHIAHYGNANNYDNFDYYVFTTATDGDITVSISNSNNNYIYTELYDNDGTTQLGATQGSAQAGITFTSTGLAAGTYYIRVYAGGGSYAGYTLSTTFSSNPFPNDGVFNNYYSTAPSFAQNDSIKGHIAYRSNGGSYDNFDYFSFYSNGDYDITISIINNNNNYVYVNLYDTDTTTLLGATQGSAQAGLSFTTTGLAAGTYYIRVYAGAGSYCGYTLKNSYTVNGVVNDVEPNNTPAQAISTSYNSTNTGHIAYRQIGGSYDVADYYVFTTPADGNINLSIANTNNNYIYLDLYDTDGTTQLGATQGSAQAGIGFTAYGLNAGTYYIRVYAGGGSYAGYTLTKSLTPTPYTNDAELNGSIATALTFNPNSTTTGHIAHRLNGGAYDSYDYYKLVTTGDGNISLNLTNDNNNYNYLYLYDSDGATVLTATQGSAAAGITCSASGLAAGTYYVLVYAGGGSYAGYTLTNTFTPAAFNNDVEANNTFATASILNNNASKQGHLAYRYNGGSYDNYDYWKITMLQTDSMRLDLTMANTNYSYVYFYDGAQNQIYSNQGGNSSYSIFFNSLPAGDYYMMVYAGGGSFNSYSINHFYYPCNTSASSIVAGGPTTFCQPGSVALNSVNAYASYLWSNGATTGSINATASGTYNMIGYDNDACPHTSNSIVVNAVPAPTPIITPSGSTTFCQGGSVSLNAGSGYSSYLWSNGATSQSISVNSTGNYFVTVTNASGCTGTSASISVTVNPLPTPSITPLGPTTFCTGGSVTLDAGAGYSSYLWSNGGTAQTTTVSAAGNYSVTVTDGNGCSGTSAQITVTVTSTGVPTISANGPLSFCQGGSVTLTATAGTSYSWSNGATSQSIMVSSNGTFTVTVTGAGGCSGTSNPVTVSVNPLPAVTLGAFSNVCNNASAFTLTGGSPSGGMYSGTGVSSNMFDPSVAGVGTFQITYTYSDGNGCSNSATSNITVDNCGCTPPSEPAAISGPSGVCRGDNNVVFTATPVAGATSYVWSLPAGMTGSSSSASINVNIGNTFSTSSICVRAVNACGQSNNTCVSITRATAKPTLPSNISGPLSICDGSVQTYSVATISNASSFTWTIPTGATLVSGQGTNSIMVSFANNFSQGYIRVKASNCYGSSSERIITVTGFPILPHPGIGAFPTTGVCGGGTYNYNLLSMTGAVSFTWGAPAGSMISDGNTSGNPLTTSSPNVSITFPNGFVSGNVTIAGNNACGSGSVRSVLVRSTPLQPQGISGQSTGVCNSTQTYSIAVVAGASQYSWTTTGGASIVGANNGLSVQVSFPSNFSSGNVCVSAVNSCGTGASRCLSAVGRPATAGAISGSSAVCKSSVTSVYSIAAIPGATSYQWTASNGATVSGSGTSVTINFINVGAGSFTLTARGVNACGAAQSSAKTVTVNNCRIASDEITSMLSAYPNPAFDFATLTFESVEASVYEIQVTDLSGKIVLKQNGTSVQGENKAELDMRNLSQGIYIIHLSHEGQTQQLKIVKE